MVAPTDFHSSSRIIRQAMREAGLLQRGEDPQSDDYGEYLPRLNDLINVIQTQGVKLWVNALQPVTLTAGEATYTLGPGGTILATKPMRVLHGYYVTASEISTSLGEPMSWEEYHGLSNKTQQGAVSRFFVDKQRSNIVVKLWLVPDAAAAQGRVDLVIQKQVGNLTMITEEMSFPQEWYIALYWGLADEICTGQPQSVRDRCAQKAMYYRQLLEDWDVEDSSTMFVLG